MCKEKFGNKEWGDWEILQDEGIEIKYLSSARKLFIFGLWDVMCSGCIITTRMLFLSVVAEGKYFT